MDERIFQELMTGHEQIDQEHLALFEITKKLDTSEEAQESYFFQTMKEIIMHLLLHFKYEEDLMRECHYPQFNAHVQEHEDILISLNPIIIEDYEPGYSEYNIKQLIKKWGFHHFLNADIEFFRYAKRLGLAT